MMHMKYFEANFDGLVGPTHNYGGLSFGNLASSTNANQVSNPKEAAKQGLKKAKALADMGLVQGILPPQMRPDIQTLKQLGFTGATHGEILKNAFLVAPELLNVCASASSMWTANAATISSSANTKDGKLHLTPANLINQFHRSLEPKTTSKILRAIFNNENYFVHHASLPAHSIFSDEGAANHTSLCQNFGTKGVEVFVYGASATQSNGKKPVKYPARQTLEASKAIARLHKLDSTNTVFVQQNPDVIDKGVFHNDVIAVGNQNVLFYHQDAFVNSQQQCQEIEQKLNGKMYFIEVSRKLVSVENAVATYLFNSQLLTLPNKEMVLIAPEQCQQNKQVLEYLNQLIGFDNPIKKVHFFDLKQSMQNGGGPACLRLRVPLNTSELAAINQSVLLTETLFDSLNVWIDKYYRDRLSVADLADPHLLIESYDALDELTQIMQLGNIYPFQNSQ